MSRLRAISILFAACVATFLLHINPASAAVLEVLGQTTPITAYGTAAFSQTFVPTQTGRITSVTIFPIETIGGGVQIYAGAGGGTLLHDQAVAWVGNQPQTIVLTTPVPVTAGQTYTLDPYGTILGVSCCSTDTYPDGELYFNGVSYYSWSFNVADMYFQVVIEHSDSDGDGYSDDIDAFPNDPTRAVSCEPGFYGAFTCQPAPLGTYVPAAAALVATPCPVGTFSNVEGAVACQPAQPGYFVDFVGAAAPTACSPGTYQAGSGQNSCTLADPGYFVATAAAIAQTACPAGYTSTAGAIECYRINTAPTAVPGGPYLAAVNETILLDGSASTDPEGDTLTESWTALDGSVAGNAYTAGAEAGIYDVCLTVNDGDLDSETVCTMVVVYDPGAGFVTGGGWINSPAGAYTADPNLAGKATFGFVARYKKGANVPDGSTNFQFQVGDLHFESTSYDWLVVAGSSAQFKGEGTINGSGSYQFMIWAGDGSPDTFRIRIWDEGGTIYDNGSQQSLGGGSIVVHSK